MRIMVLAPTAEGHFLEYIEYLSMVATQKKNDDFIFVLHPFFKGEKVINRMKESNNTFVYYLDDSDVCFSKNYLISAFQRTKMLISHAKAKEADAVFLIMTMPYSPFIFFPFFVRKEIYGIVYDIYLYRWKSNTLAKKLYDVFRYFIISNSNRFSKIFILNDFVAANIFNRIYRTKKFVGLPDPFRKIQTISSVYNLREKFDGRIIVSHIGSLKERKGTYDIIKALMLLSKNTLDNYAFVFAGKPDDPVRFAEQLSKLGKNVCTYYIEGFISFENIGEIVKSSDLLLLPYHNTNQSSGIIGYAAQFRTPVVVPNKELLGKITRKYNLGFLLEGHESCYIKSFLEQFKNEYLEEYDYSKMMDYLNSNNVSNFVNTIKNNL